VKEITLPVSEFRERCLRLLNQVAKDGDMLILTKRGQPVARVTAINKPPKSLRGTWKGVVEIKGDIVYFDTADIWDAAR